MLTSKTATQIKYDGSALWSKVAESLGLGSAWGSARPDGCFWDGGHNLILVECFARTEKPKAGQLRKVAKDALKLATIKRIVENGNPKGHINVHCIIVMPCGIVHHFQNDGWLSAAFKEHGVEIIGVKLSVSKLRELTAAQQRQTANMAHRKNSE